MREELNFSWIPRIYRAAQKQVLHPFVALLCPEQYALGDRRALPVRTPFLHPSAIPRLSVGNRRRSFRLATGSGSSWHRAVEVCVRRAASRHFYLLDSSKS